MPFLEECDRKGTGSSPHVSLLKKNSGSTLKTKLNYTGDPEALEQSGKLFVVLCLQVTLVPKHLYTSLERTGTSNLCTHFSLRFKTFIL